jgi:Dolichyl-phosphate-mannose-protein mannosyltransferase
MSTSGRRREEEIGTPALHWLVAVAAVLLVSAVRFRLVGVPLERDEGEYAYAAQTLLRGFAPYALAANVKLPGTYYAYAGILAIFGQSIEAIHLGLLVVNLATVVLVALIARQLWDTTAGLAAGAAYAAMSVGPSVMGTAAHASHFVALFALAALWLLLRWDESRRPSYLIASGFSFGLAFLMKQPGVAFGIFGTALVIAAHWRELHARPRRVLRSVSCFLAACAAPFLVLCAALWSAHLFDRFWSWTFTYARFYGASISVAEGIGNLAQSLHAIVEDQFAIALMATWGLVSAWLRARDRRSASIATGLLAASFAFVVPGFTFRSHYFVALLPAVALVAGAGVSYARDRLTNPGAALVWAACLLSVLLSQRQLLFHSTPHEVSRTLYGTNPFPEAIAVGSYIREHASPDARIAVLGSEPEIYFYSRRLSASSHLYTYALMERHPAALLMQYEMIADIEKAQPEYVVFVNASTSWLRNETSSMRILDWWREYRPERYALVGLVDILSPHRTIIKWEDEVANYRPGSLNTIQIYKRI